MAIPGTTRAEKVSAEEKPRNGSAACDVLLVGPEGLALRPMIEKLLPEGHGPDAIDGAESILEAVLMSGGGGRLGEVPVIVTGISQELEQIEQAIRSMRKVYPRSRIVLLCEPGDEVLCRKAKNWGASDYVILPADTGVLRRMLSAEAPLPAPASAASPAGAAARKPIGNGQIKPLAVERAAAPAAVVKQVVQVNADHVVGAAEALDVPEMQAGDAGVMPAAEEIKNRIAGAGDLSLPALPLLVQAVLFNDLLMGRNDFVDRVIANLQAYVRWGGTLRFTPADATTGALVDAPAEIPATLSCPVGLPKQQGFGTLYVEPHPGIAPTAAVGAALKQAAHWMASLMSISRRYEQLRSLAITDELSGAFNRRYFTKFMNQLLERARANRFRVTLLLFDIDDFKKYNDTFGHASGDAIIRELIKLLRSCTRAHDLVARLGGDEFACVYWDNEAPRTPNSEHPRDAIAATERFRKAVQEHQWSSACNIQGEVSISGGLATFPWDADSLDTLMTRADEALLRAKAAGKNVFLLHGENCKPGTPEDTSGL